ncbi:acyltransferase family protein [Rheinheimera riviphila]|uniref:acyltransferase family protein n=1 Tax=Rheinheimera riviphila TaxID=1834037 RepID=UPI0013E34FBA|nr:acyltransferase family protein [Rheinheimera riviphila]
MANTKPGIGNTLSLAIHKLRVPLVLLILYVHAWPILASYTNTTRAFSELGVAAGIAWLLADALANHFGRVAVPLLFMISGYLLFFNFAPTLRQYLQLLQRRSYSLFIPFLSWNLLIWLFFSAGLSFSLTQPYFQSLSTLVTQETLGQWLAMIFGFDRNPLAYQFWFVRDLMLMVLISPLILLLLRYFNASLPLLMLGLWLVGSWPWFAPALLSCCFFSVGAYLGWRQYDVTWLARHRKTLLCGYVLLFIGLSAGQALMGDLQWIRLWPLAAEVSVSLLSVFSKVLVLLGCCTLLSIALALTHPVPEFQNQQSKSVSAKALSTQQQASSLAFFIFAAHEPLLTIVRKLSVLMLPASFWLDLLLFMLLPLMLSWGLFQVFRLMQRFTPTLGYCLTGNFTRHFTGDR